MQRGEGTSYLFIEFSPEIGAQALMQLVGSAELVGLIFHDVARPKKVLQLKCLCE